MEEKLKEFDLRVEHSQDQEREPIDFEIRDDQDILWATVWGSEPSYDVQIDCDHPAVEYDDDETVGECPICGATCDWHYQTSVDDGYTIKERMPHEWYYPKKIGGIVGEYLKKLQEKW